MDDKFKKFLIYWRKRLSELDNELEKIINKKSDNNKELIISLCESCYCMTKTIKGKCGKCGVRR